MKILKKGCKMTTERGTYLPLTWNRDTGELGVHLPQDNKTSGDMLDKQPPKLAYPSYLVETTVTYRMRYVVSCQSEEHAMDTVVMEEAKEFSQHYLGEQIISARPINHDEIIAMCDEDNDYCKSWDAELKYKNFVTVVDYDK